MAGAEESAGDGAGGVGVASEVDDLDEDVLEGAGLADRPHGDVEGGEDVAGGVEPLRWEGGVGGGGEGLADVDADMAVLDDVGHGVERLDPVEEVGDEVAVGDTGVNAPPVGVGDG